MDYVASLHPTPQAWLRNSALAPHIDAYAAYLRQGRYASVTTRGYLTCVAHFAHWMSQGCLQVPQVEERSIRQFLDEHLRNCNCPGSVMRVYGDLRADFDNCGGTAAGAGLCLWGTFAAHCGDGGANSWAIRLGAVDARVF